MSGHVEPLPAAGPPYDTFKSARRTVASSDGAAVGHVDGFICNDNGNVTHLVLQHGNAFDRDDLAIPISEVTRIDNDAVSVSLTSDELGSLPGVSVHRFHHPH